MIEATWLGHSAWRFQGKSATVFVDPFLDENPASPLKVADVTKADVVCVTHDHFDHIADAAALCKKTGAVLFATYEVATGLAKEHGIEVEPMNHGGSVSARGVTVHMVPAIHTAGKGAPSGFVIEWDGVKVYHAGDTCLFSDMKLIGEWFRPDLACVPIGDRFTMGLASAAKAIEWIRPRYAAPMHYNTWPLIDQDPQRWKALVGAHAEVMTPKPGESFSVGPRIRALASD